MYNYYYFSATQLPSQIQNVTLTATQLRSQTILEYSTYLQQQITLPTNKIFFKWLTVSIHSLSMNHHSFCFNTLTKSLVSFLCLQSTLNCNFSLTTVVSIGLELRISTSSTLFLCSSRIPQCPSSGHQEIFTPSHFLPQLFDAHVLIIFHPASTSCSCYPS